MSKGNYFTLRVLAPTFDPSSAHLGAPVEGLTADPARIQDEFKPGSSLLRNIPAHLPDLALGQRWAKGYYTQALHQKGKVGKNARRPALQGLLVSEAQVGRKVVAVDYYSAYTNSRYVCLCACARVCVCVCVCLCVCVCVWIYRGSYKDVYICMYICICICIYIGI
jgi:hypothetical protein